MTRRALEFAKDKHEGQRRKFNGEPYVAHPVRVAKRLLRFKKTSRPELLQSAALLHDVVEDTDATLHEVAQLCDYNVASIVEEVTNEGFKIERLGKAEYMARKCLGMTEYALVVKLSDRLDNTSDLEQAPKGFARRYSRQTKHLIWRLREGRDLTGTQDALLRAIWHNVR